MFKLASKLDLLKEQKSILENQVTELKKKIAWTEEELIRQMTENEVQNFTNRGKQFILTVKDYYSVKAENKPKLFDWLKANGHEALIKEDINAQTLNAFGREISAENDDSLPDSLSDILNVYEKVSISMRKAAKK
ncbi:MAG: hypothetical protein ACI3ZR_02690 [bacterium]